MASGMARERVRPRRALITVAAGFLGGVLFHAALPNSSDAPGDTSRVENRVPAANTSTGPSTLREGVRSGFARTQEGAVAAAASYVCTGQALLDMDPLAAEKAVRHMAADTTADNQVRQTLAKLRDARQALAPGSGPIDFRQAAVASRVEAWSPDRARVAVWNVGVLSREGVAPPQAAWAVSTFDLVWDRDDWKVWSETIAPGPAPILDDSAPPATAQQLVSTLDGFTDLGTVR